MLAIFLFLLGVPTDSPAPSPPVVQPLSGDNGPQPVMPN